MLINAIFFANVLAQLGVSIEFSQAETRIQIQGEAAAQTGEASALEPITYHVGGTVISEPLTIYYIYYGAWSAAQKAVIKTFTDGLGASDWWGMSTKYYALNNGKTFVTSSITYGKDVDDNYSMGKQLTGGSTQKIVQSKLNDGSLPYDINGIYFLLTSKDVSESSGPSNTFCANYCGYHAPRFTPSGQPILIAMAGVIFI